MVARRSGLGLVLFAFACGSPTEGMSTDLTAGGGDDLTVGPGADLAGRDLTAPPGSDLTAVVDDLTMVVLADLKAPVSDLAGVDLAGLDLAVKPADLSVKPADLIVNDLAVKPADLSVKPADLAVVADLAPPPPDLIGADLLLVKAQPATQVTTPYFDSSAPWYKDYTTAAVASDSAAITQWMVGYSGPNGFGGGGRIRVDFSIVAVEVPANTPKRTHAHANGFYYTPDCDTSPIPVPVGGAVEETYLMPTVFNSPFSGYNCFGFNSGDDCHMLFVARSERRLYEVYHATINTSNVFTTGCLAVWDTTSPIVPSPTTTSTNPSPDFRGQQCTSADAAGFPIAPLLFSAEEIQAGVINHATRFILPNDMIRMRKYVYPATHGTNTTGPATSGPYGFHMRLKPGAYAGVTGGGQVVVAALKKYGMFMADGGNIALTAQSDILSTVKWSSVNFDANSLNSLKATDFEVLDHGPPIDVTQNCGRTQITN